MDLSPTGTLISLVIFSALVILWRSLRYTVVKTPIRNLPGPGPQSWLKGNLNQIYSPKGMSFHREIAKYGGAVKVYGICGDEHIYFSDPLALQNIVVTNQHIFEEPAMFLEGNKLIFGYGLASISGDHHRRQRKLLNPIFSSQHLASLTPIFYGIAHQVCRTVAEKVKGGEIEINIHDWMSRVGLEAIGQAGLGHSFEALDQSKKNRYGESIKDLIPTIFSVAVYRQFVPFLVRLGPVSLRRWLVKHLPSTRVQRLKRIIDMMEEESKAVLDHKRQALRLAQEKNSEVLMEQIGMGKDIMSVLLRANHAASEVDRLSDRDVLGQMTTFIFAGHDTTSSIMSRILQLLSLHPDAQVRLRQEVTEARAKHGDLSYEALFALPYLDAVCRETLRLHSPATFLSRTARSPAVVPLMHPITGTDGRTITAVPISKNQNVIIGVAAANRDPSTWGPDALEWKPERWLHPLPESVHRAALPGVYSHMMTFLGGGRACIGFRFSLTEIKVVMSVLIEKFAFSPTGHDIIWNLGNVQKPAFKHVGKETLGLPLKVSLV